MKHKQKPVLLLGAGGHAKVLINMLRLCDREIIGVLSPGLNDTVVAGVKVIGSDEKLIEFNPEEVELVNAVGQLPNDRKRENLYLKGKNIGFIFSSVIHPSAIIANDVALCEGVQIMAGVIIEPGVIVGKNAILNTACSINHDVTIGSHSHIAPGVVICGGVIVGCSAFVGTNATLVPFSEVNNFGFVKAGKVYTHNNKVDI